MTCHIIPHIYAPILLIFLSISEDKQTTLVASKRSKCSGGDVRLFILSESSRYRQLRTRYVTTNILAQQRRRNGTETWRRRSCQCEHLRLITHVKILLNGDVPRRNGNVTYSGNRPLVDCRRGRRQSSKTYNTYQLSHMYIATSWWGVTSKCETCRGVETG
jgi:hypothetical protein